VFRWRATYCWKNLDEGYNFTLDFTSIRGLHIMLWASKVAGVPILGILRQNDIWVLVPWLGTKYTIRGKVVASPKFGLWWVMWIHVCPWFVRAPKMCSYALTNLLFSLCRSMWVTELLVNLLSLYLEDPTRPSTPKVLRTKERASTPSPSAVFIFGLAVSPSRSLGVCHHLFD